MDLSRDLDDDVLGEIRQALLENLVIFFRDQRLTPEGREWGCVGDSRWQAFSIKTEALDATRDRPDGFLKALVRFP